MGTSSSYFLFSGDNVIRKKSKLLSDISRNNTSASSGLLVQRCSPLEYLPSVIATMVCGYLNAGSCWSFSSTCKSNYFLVMKRLQSYRLVYAAKDGLTDVVIQTLKINNINVNMRADILDEADDYYGKTALHYAITGETINKEMAVALIGHKDIDLNCIAYAVSYDWGYTRMEEDLKDQNLFQSRFDTFRVRKNNNDDDNNIMISNENGVTPLISLALMHFDDILSENYISSTYITNLLLNHPNINTQVKGGPDSTTAFMYANENNRSLTQYLNQYLLQRIAYVIENDDNNINELNENGDTLLNIAIAEGNEGAFDALMKVKSIDINCTNARQAPIAQIFQTGPINSLHFDMFLKLIEKSQNNVNSNNKSMLDVNGQSHPDHAREDGCTALFYLAKMSDSNFDHMDMEDDVIHDMLYDVVHALLKNSDIDINLSSDYEVTPLFASIRWGSIEFTELLLRQEKINVKGSLQYCLNVIKEDGNLSRNAHFDLLLQCKKINVNSLSNITYQGIYRFYPPISLALLVNNMYAFNKLLNHKQIKIDVRTTCHGGTPLFEAIREQNIKAVELLLESDANVEIALRRFLHPTNLSCIQFQCEDCSNNVAERFRCLNWEGVTPLMLAVQQDNFKIVEMLIKAGANVNVKNKIGEKAIDFTTKDIPNIERKNTEKIRLALEQKC